MPNAYATNFTLYAVGETFSAIWKMTRTMLAAGWRYKASANGQSGGTKDTSADASFDTWAGSTGGVNLSSASRGTSAGSVVINAASNTTGLAILSGVSGFTTSSIGDYLVITGSTATTGPGSSGTNNGTYRITAQTGTGCTIYAPGMVAESGNAGLAVTEKFGGAAASFATGFTTTTSGQSTLLTVSGLTGMQASDVGKYLTFNIGTGTAKPASAGNQGSFLIVSFISATSVTIWNPFGVPSDANNGTIQWVEFDPLQQQYPANSANTGGVINGTNGTGTWIDLQGPTVMKIPIQGLTPTGTFIRGENVTQTNTGAQGELLGIVTDTSTNAGFLVIAPRVVGTGGQAGSATSANMTYGWNNTTTSDTITGAISGATITGALNTVSVVPIAYIRETVLWKGSTASQGHIYHQCIDQNSATESATTALAGRFSTLAALGTATAQICPGGATGGSPTTNGFPTTGTYILIGTGGSGAAGTGQASAWTLIVPTSPGKAQMLCANNIEQQGVSADGSWSYLQSCNSVGYQSISYQRMDNQEDGDVDPYVHQGHFNASVVTATPNRTVMTSGTGSVTDNMTSAAQWFSTGNGHGWAGFRRRGLSGENFVWFGSGILFDASTQTVLMLESTGIPDQVSTTVATTYVREPIWCVLGNVTQNAGVRMRKGTCRWLFQCMGGSTNATFDSKQWLILSPTSAMLVIGPYDGVTTPIF